MPPHLRTGITMWLTASLLSEERQLTRTSRLDFNLLHYHKNVDSNYSIHRSNTYYLFSRYYNQSIVNPRCIYLFMIPKGMRIYQDFENLKKELDRIRAIKNKKDTEEAINELVERIAKDKYRYIYLKILCYEVKQQTDRCTSK